MTQLTLLWTNPAEREFKRLRQRASTTDKQGEFVQTHNEIVVVLGDSEQAATRGEPLYHARKTGGLYRKWLHGHIAVTYLLFTGENIAWITRYQIVPSSWLEE